MKKRILAVLGLCVLAAIAFTACEPTEQTATFENQSKVALTVKCVGADPDSFFLAAWNGQLATPYPTQEVTKKGSITFSFNDGTEDASNGGNKKNPYQTNTVTSDTSTAGKVIFKDR